jgi:transcriptional regulator with XRE-family HTH domain
MKERLVQLMSYFGLTATRFADEIGVQRSGISHILNGRNQPGYDFILKTLLKFPDIDSDWLLTGRGKMLKAEKNNANPVKDVAPVQDSVNPTPKVIVTNVNLIERVIVLHKNGTFDHYDPAKKD